MSLLDFSFKEYHSFQFEALKFTRGDYFSTGHKQKKIFGAVKYVVVINKNVFIVGQSYNSNYNDIDEKTEMYKVIETNELALFDATDVKREQFVVLNEELTIVNFFCR